jgi:hypothetical protein
MSDDVHPKTHEDTIRAEMLRRLQREEAHLRAEMQRKHDEDLARCELQKRLHEEEMRLRAQMQPALQVQNQPVVINNVIQNNVVAHRPSLGFLVRALYFLFIGWWFGFVWLGAALAVGVTVIGLPIALLMLSKTIEAFFLW